MSGQDLKRANQSITKYVEVLKRYFPWTIPYATLCLPSQKARHGPKIFIKSSLQYVLSLWHAHINANMANPTTTPKSTSTLNLPPLLRIPREIRDKIYRNILKVAAPSRLEKRKDDYAYLGDTPSELRLFEGRPLYTDILVANKQIYAEPKAYSTRKIRLPWIAPAGSSETYIRLTFSTLWTDLIL